MKLILNSVARRKRISAAGRITVIALSPRRGHRDRRRFQDLANNLGASSPPELALRASDDPMRQCVYPQILHVIRHHVVAAADCRECLGGLEECEAPTRARPQSDIGMRARGTHEL